MKILTKICLRFQRSNITSNHPLMQLHCGYDSNTDTSVIQFESNANLLWWNASFMDTSLTKLSYFVSKSSRNSRIVTNNRLTHIRKFVPSRNYTLYCAVSENIGKISFQRLDFNITILEFQLEKNQDFYIYVKKDDILLNPLV